MVRYESAVRSRWDGDWERQQWTSISYCKAIRGFILTNTVNQSHGLLGTTFWSLFGSGWNRRRSPCKRISPAVGSWLIPWVIVNVAYNPRSKFSLRTLILFNLFVASIVPLYLYTAELPTGFRMVWWYARYALSSVLFAAAAISAGLIGLTEKTCLISVSSNS